ncbi:MULTISPECIES: proline iminopeptidase-family hydrolase [Liquorilactobacillus]|uniref:proline iminopeptidase-family hydrolase n=1 Tax=Liquorilactobacillus TaxID=2767888 RepID=UPI0039E93AC4
MEKTRIVNLKNGYNVWTRKIGTGNIPIVLVHGGPGMTHEYLAPFKDNIDLQKYSILLYDQLGSYFSDQPNDISLWDIKRFCDELDEVRSAWKFKRFVLYGQSFGGMVALEYATKYTSNLYGVIISNMVDSVEKYRKRLYEIRDSFGSKAAKLIINCENNNDLYNEQYRFYVNKMYKEFFCRQIPWPTVLSDSLQHANFSIVKEVFGLKEFDITGNAKDWTVENQISDINVPVLLMSSKYDTMNPYDVKKMSDKMSNASLFISMVGSHLAILDDTKSYFKAINEWLDKNY